MHKNEYLLKVMVLGHSTKLKEKLMNILPSRKTSKKISKQDYMLGYSIFTQRVRVDDQNIKLILMVTIEDSVFDYEKMKQSWYRGTSAGAIFFDKGDTEIYNTVEERIKEFKKYLPHTGVPLHLVGVKIDNDFISIEEAQILADKYQIKYFEVSFDDIKSLRKVFRSLTSLALEAK
jgi:GTPase SAR1 family protein